ncbi:AAA family ATPase [Actinoplanes friuliensis]|uniref:LuxR family transcriptional regulator n=1 Tax=Actinoplanes friuliensis DSM 7358 TaxID=1246995 RepID=U5VYL3_9ACTN|nr:LuxR family transcriptional regulator [Actinoplanes friuliensis]AGZ40751.1 LuxR family transcriptional regulator [Actinoplanes friuliensis DSM 7358]
MDLDGYGLVGRADKLADLGDFLQEAARTGSAMLLAGEPGIGKTALLNAAAERAAAMGMRVIRGSGAEHETALCFSGLHQLVGPLSAELAQLPGPSRYALEVALGFGAGSTPAEMTVLHGVLSLFAEAARKRPLLLVVDDLHVLDRPSRSVISFVARRAVGRRFGVLAAVRSETMGSYDSGLTEVLVPPLHEADALHLLSERFAELPRRAALDVVRQAQGNPLALLEFGALAGMSGAPRDAVPGTGPAKEVRALYAARVARLPAGTRELLLLAALESSGDLGVLHAAAGEGGLDAFGAAERDLLIQVSANGRHVHFQHPLVRSAVIEGATLEQRRSAHQRLADVLVDRPERHAEHLSMAAAGPDEPVAHLVEQWARQSLQRGDVLGAMDRLRRAAALSPDRSVGDRRLAYAAYIGVSVAGHLELSCQLMRELDGAAAMSRSLPVAAARGYLHLMTDGDAATAYRILVEAISPLAVTGATDLDELMPALYTLLLICHYSGRADLWAPLRDLVASLPRDSASSPVSMVHILEDVGAVPDELLRDLDGQIARLPEVTDADVIIRTALTASYLDRLSGCHQSLTEMIRDARDSGTIGGALPALLMCAMDDLYSGRWVEAQGMATEILVLGRETGFHLPSQFGRYVMALLAAHRGDTDTCAALAQELHEWAASRRLGRLTRWAHMAQTRAALGSSDFETAFRHAAAITAPGWLPPFNIEALWTALDLTESALRSGRADAAREHVAAMRNSGVARISPRFALMTATMTALTAPPAEMAHHFDRALALPGIEHWPFELARTELAYGEQLRRQALKAEARVQLSAARDRFERLGATPWVARASAELRATGNARASKARVGVTLTPQEWEVTELAAAGLANKEIAARLMLSPRTVSSHLYRVFPKLGISSRAALRDALNGRRSG